jgi:hypothetical protein
MFYLELPRNMEVILWDGNAHCLFYHIKLAELQTSFIPFFNSFILICSFLDVKLKPEPWNYLSGPILYCMNFILHYFTSFHLKCPKLNFDIPNYSYIITRRHVLLGQHCAKKTRVGVAVKFNSFLSSMQDRDLCSISRYAFCPIHRDPVWPSLWSSCQSSWLQIRRPWFDSRHYQIF